ncbi:unnamed protein product [Porites lobata]|uniref:Uncharacterized protein n=1 Tax=Porites lobata TaxID=104759 RepID=A0ABN8QJ68_9CNID|nr:unnamed protein product [Porites lobata]
MLKVFPQKYVFFSTAAGPAQCYYCLESDSATCSANQRVQTCATDASSLGTTHCGSAAGKYRDRRGNINFGVVRGCINCADKLQACGLIYGALKADRQWTVLQCEIECCTGDKCNTGTVPTLPTPGSDKREACGIIGGALKVSREWTVLQCEIECCTGDKCNSQLVPTLSSKASSGGTINTRLQFTGVLAFVQLSLSSYGVTFSSQAS